MPQLNLDYATDCFVCTILDYKQPELTETYDPFVASIGYDILDLDARRAKAHKLIAKYLNQFKATAARPITKYYLLSKQVQPDLIDLYLPLFNTYCVQYGITTPNRLDAFFDCVLKYSNSLRLANPAFLPVTDISTKLDKAEQVEETCKLWRSTGCNYYADKGAIKQIEQRIGL